MTEFVIRVTIFVPEAMIPDANQLALCLGQSEEDANTFGGAVWRDTQGNRYAVASTVATAAFSVTATTGLTAPNFTQSADLTAAARAQAALVTFDPANPVQAAPDRILAIVHDTASVALALAGVAPQPHET